MDLENLNINEHSGSKSLKLDANTNQSREAQPVPQDTLQYSLQPQQQQNMEEEEEHTHEYYPPQQKYNSNDNYNYGNQDSIPKKSNNQGFASNTDQDDEIKEGQDSIISETQQQSNSPNNSNNNLNCIETNDSLSKCRSPYDQSSANNLQMYYKEDPLDDTEKIYQKSCDQIDRIENKRKQFELTLEINKKQSSNDPSPKRYIQKRVSMLPTVQQQRFIDQQAESPSRRKSLPDFNEDKEPDYDINPEDMYKIYAGDAIDEQDPDAIDYGDDDGIVCEEDGICENENQEKHKKNEKNLIQRKSQFKIGSDDEDAAETPIIKNSKFSEDREFVQKKKIENGGVTPQKYLGSQKNQFKAFKY